MGQEPPNAKIEPAKTLSSHFRTAWREWRTWRPFSFFLIFAMVLVLILGVQMARVRHDPTKFAFYLSLFFVFFLVVAVRAVVDVIDILCRQYRENRDIFRTTLGDHEFITELGRRVGKNRKE